MVGGAVLALASGASCEHAEPKLERVEPSRGLSDRETPIVLIGRTLDPPVEENEENGRRVAVRLWTGEVGGRPLRAIAFVSSERIEALVPPDLPPGPYDIILRAGGRTVRLAQAYTSVTPVAPRIDSASPPRIAATGGSVELIGAGLHFGSTVAVDGVRVPDRWVDDQTLVISVGPRGPGPARIEVSTPVGAAWREDLVRFVE